MSALKTTSRRLQLESLENRELMAGNVSVSFSGSELRIVGDSAANHIEVRQSSPGVYKINGVFEGGSPTKVNGSTGTITARNVNGNVVIAMGANDFFKMLYTKPRVFSAYGGAAATPSSCPTTAACSSMARASKRCGGRLPAFASCNVPAWHLLRQSRPSESWTCAV